jgi:sporulation protein YlmC with PRC-barrel domain
MRVSEILGLPVRTESGRSLGRVHDVRGEIGERHLRVTGLVVGGLGVLERLGIGAPHALERLRGRDAVPWESVLRVDRRGVVVRDAQLRESPGER